MLAKLFSLYLDYVSDVVSLFLGLYELLLYDFDQAADFFSSTLFNYFLLSYLSVRFFKLLIQVHISVISIAKIINDDFGIQVSF